MRPAGPRAAAVAALLHQEQGGYANLVLDAELARSGLTGRDRAFAGAVFYTTVEKQAALDYILGRFLPKGVEKLDPPVRAILRSGLAQALGRRQRGGQADPRLWQGQRGGAGQCGAAQSLRV